MNPVRASFLTPSLCLGGAELWMRDLAEHSTGRIEWLGCAIANTWDNDPEAWKAMGRYMRVWGYGRKATQHVCSGADVLVSWGVRNLGYLVNGFGGKVVLVTHGADMAWTRAVVTGSAGAATHFAAVSRAARKPYLGLIPWDRVRVIENGVNSARCEPAETRQETRKRLGIRDNHFLVGYCGRYSSEKRPTVIAEALEKLPARFRGLWVGDGHQRAEMQLRIVQAIGRRAVFVPRVSDVGTYYRAMDLCVLPSETEGFSLTSLEAMHCGVPFASTPVGAEPELAERFGRRWWALPPHCSAGDLAGVISEVAKTTAAAKQSRVVAAKEMVDKNFLAGHMADRWVSFLEEITK